MLNPIKLSSPINFKKWIDENRHLLKPPVGNQTVYHATNDFIVMVVGGPNSRKDYHYNETEEFFHQLEGDIVLKVIENQKPKDIPIRQGEIFLLPPRVPHSPRRPAHTVGLVMERVRTLNNMDGFLWFCEKCTNVIHEEYFHLEDIVKQFPPILDRFYSSVAKRTCKKCGSIMEPPPKI